MATSTLIIYEPIEKFKNKQSYWRNYVSFYEKYWGGPPSPLGVWFGNEYNIFRAKLADELNMDEEDIVDCFFLKDGEGKHYIAPPDNRNIFSSRDFIPIEWFFVFSEDERKELHSHWGFNAIHYTATIAEGIERLTKASGSFEKALKDKEIDKIDVTLKPQFQMILKGINNMIELLSSYDNSGFVVLNYGDICSVIHPYTLRNERSVKEVADLTEMLQKKRYKDAASFLRIFNEKWDEIRRKCSGEIDKSPLQ